MSSPGDAGPREFIEDWVGGKVHPHGTPMAVDFDYDEIYAHLDHDDPVQREDEFRADMARRVGEFIRWLVGNTLPLKHHHPAVITRALAAAALFNPDLLHGRTARQVCEITGVSRYSYCRAIREAAELLFGPGSTGTTTSTTTK